MGSRFHLRPRMDWRPRLCLRGKPRSPGGRPRPALAMGAVVGPRPPRDDVRRCSRLRPRSPTPSRAGGRRLVDGVRRSPDPFRTIRSALPRLDHARSPRAVRSRPPPRLDPTCRGVDRRRRRPALRGGPGGRGRRSPHDDSDGPPPFRRPRGRGRADSPAPDPRCESERRARTIPQGAEFPKVSALMGKDN